MQAINRFTGNYIQPVIDHPVSQFTFKLVIEVVKIITAKIFLEYLADSYLKNPAKISKHEVYEAIIFAPIAEEILFRLVVLQSIHLTQIILNHFEKDIQLASNIFGSSDRDPQSNNSVITIYPPLMEETFCQGYVHSIYWITKDDIQEESKEEDKKEKLQQIFRIHLAALIFAAAHLANPHSNKTSALTQFVWTYLGGIIYGYLSEKYHSLAPGVLVHGFNNSLTTASKIYPELVPFIIVALFVNRIASYILAVTSIDKVVLTGVGQARNFCYSLLDFLVNGKNEPIIEDV